MTLLHLPRTAHHERVRVFLAYDWQADRIIAVRDGIHDSFIERNVRQFRFIDEPAALGPPFLKDLKETRSSNQSAEIADLGGNWPRDVTVKVGKPSILAVCD